MPDGLVITELLIDSAQAIAGADAVVPALERVAAAAQGAAGSVDKLGLSLDGFGAKGVGAAGGVTTLTTAVAASTREIAAQDAALVRQSAAAGGSLGATVGLNKALNDLTLAQAAVRRGMADQTITAEAGNAELARLTARHDELSAASDKLRTGAASLAGVLAQHPVVLSAIGAATSKAAGNTAELSEAFEKFRAGGIGVGALIQQFPGLLGNVSTEAKSLVSRYDELSTALTKYHAGTINAATATAAFPQLVSAAGNEIDKLATSHANLLTNLEKFKSQQIELSQLITLYPQAVGPATSSLERYVKAHVDTAVAATASAAAQRAAVGPVKELDAAVEHSEMTHRQQHAVLTLVRALLEGDYKRALESATVTAERFHLVHLSMNPVVLATGAALVVTAAAFVAVAEHVFEAESNLRSFNLQLSTVADTSSGQTATGLQALDKQLRETGSSAADAKKSIDTILQAAPQGVNPANAPMIANLARDIGAATGVGEPAATKALTNALADGVEGIIKYGIAVNGLSADQAALMRQLEELGHAPDAARIGFDALSAKFSGSFDKSLSDTDRLLIQLKNTWDEALESLSKTGVFDFLITKLKEVTVEVTNLLKKVEQDPEKTLTTIGERAGGVLTGTAIGFRVGGIPGAVVGGGLGGASGASFDTLGGVAGGALLGGRIAGVPGLIAGGVLGGAVGVEGTKNAVEAADAFWDTFVKKWDDLQQTLGNGRPSEEAAKKAAAPQDQTGALATAEQRAAAAQDDLAKSLAERGATEQEIQRTLTSNSEAHTSNTEALKDLTGAVQGAGAGGGGQRPLSVGGAVQGVVGGGLFGAVAQLESGGRNITQQINDVNSRNGTPAQGVFQITDPTWRQFAPPQILGQYSSALQAPAEVQQDVASLIPLARWGANTRRAIQAQFGPLDESRTLGELAGATSGISSALPIGGTGPILDVGKSLGGSSTVAAQEKIIQATTAQTDAVNKQTEADTKSLVVTDQVGAARVLAAAHLEAENRATALRLEGTDRENFLTEQDAKAQTQLNQQYKQGADLANITAAGEAKIAAGYGQSVTEGTKNVAMLQATLQTRQTGIPVEQAYNQILTKNANDAISQLAQREATQTVALSRNQQVADAALKGAAAEHEAQIQAQAAATSYDALAKAQATGNPDLIQRAQNLQAVAEAQAKVNERQREEIDLGHNLQQGRDKLEVNQLEATLVGRTREEQEKQVSILRTKQLIQERGSELTDKEKAEWIAMTAAIGDSNIKLAEQERAQQRINTAAESIANTIENQIGTAMDNAFSGKKAVSWGETMKTILRDLLKQIVEFTLIQPAIGTALGALGLSQAAQKFGSFGDLFGGGGGGIDPVSGLSTSTTNGGTLGSLGTAFSGIKSILGLGDAISGNSGGLLSSVGSLFGIGQSASVGASIAGTGGLTAQALLDAAPTAAIGTGLVGETALSAGGISSALGGIGGALGGIGSAIGSIIPFVGPIVGIASLIGGLFGNKKPSLASSGDVLDLSSGTAGGFASSGNAQNDASVNSMTQTIQAFEQTLKQETGGTLPGGQLNLVQTLKGVEVNYAGELGNIHAKFADASSAITAIETVLAQNLSGISDTLKTALAHITDPNQIQAAVQFSATYDSLQKSVDAALKGVAGDIQATVGPFATAMTTLNKQFADLSLQAQQFGLSLDPINQALALATTRLQQDFGRALDTIIAGSGGDYLGKLQQVSAGFATNVTDAIAIGLGGDQTISGKIAQAEAVQAQAILSQLNTTQLQDIINKLGATNPEIAAMAQAILNAGTASTAATAAANAAAAAAQTLTTNLDSLKKAIADLTTGSLSGLPPAQAANAAVDAYQKELAAVQGGNQGEIGNLAKAATDAVTALQTAYGNAPQTSDQRAQIVASLNAVLAANPPPTAAAPAAPDTAAAQAAALQTPAVLAAQAQAAAQAAAGAAPIAASPAAAAAAAAAGPVAAPAPTAVAARAAAPAAAPPAVVATPADQANPTLEQSLADYRSGIQVTTAESNVINSAIATGALAPSAIGFPSFASGTESTPPGWILVGERGPELINQSGGAQVLPISSHSAYQWRGAAFASGTGGGSDVLEELRALRSEVSMLRQVHLGVGTETVKVAQTGNKILYDINRKAGTGLPMPARQNISVK